MNSGLYRREGEVATDFAAACANSLQAPTTKFSNVYFGFNCVRGALNMSSLVKFRGTVPLSSNSYTTPDNPIPISRSMEFTRVEYSLSSQTRVSSLGTATQSLSSWIWLNSVLLTQFW